MNPIELRRKKKQEEENNKKGKIKLKKAIMKTK